MKIISLRHAKNPKHGVVLYAKVLSRSKEGTAHTVTGIRHGDDVRYRCGCDDNLFRPRVSCDHIIAVKKREIVLDKFTKLG